MEKQSPVLTFIFSRVGEVLEENRETLNQYDPVIGNHGDQMVEVFQIATQAVIELSNASLSEALDAASARLEAIAGSEIALIYAHGLAEMANQLKVNQVSLEDLIVAVKGNIREENASRGGKQDFKEDLYKGRVFKSLLGGLVGWSQVEDGKKKTHMPLDFEALVGIGMAYMQAKERQQDRIDVLADAAASASPLAKNRCYHHSGKIVIRALLQAIQETHNSVDVE